MVPRMVVLGGTVEVRNTSKTGELGLPQHTRGRVTEYHGDRGQRITVQWTLDDGEVRTTHGLTRKDVYAVPEESGLEG